MAKCKWCGRTFNEFQEGYFSGYCSKKCLKEAEAAGSRSSGCLGKIVIWIIILGVIGAILGGL